MHYRAKSCVTRYPEVGFAFARGGRGSNAGDNSPSDKESAQGNALKELLRSDLGGWAVLGNREPRGRRRLLHGRISQEV